MVKIIFLFIFLTSVPLINCIPQNLPGNFRTQQADNNSPGGNLRITQDPAIDSLIARYVLYNQRIGGLEGFRIQIYYSSNRNAREESAKANQEFISRFPEIVSYTLFEQPGYYKIRAGDFRSKAEGTKYMLMVRKVFPDAYLVPDIINFPDQYKK